MLPTVAARDLGNDPALLSLTCAELLDYAEAYGVYKRASKAQLKKALLASRLVRLVKENDFDLAEEQMARADEGETEQ